MRRTILLDKKRHNRNAFDCSIEPLNNFLKLMANQQSSKDNSRTFVLEDVSDTTRIVGYYTLTLTQVDLSKLPKALQKKHQSSKAAGLIARLAVDKNYKGQRLGEWLLIDALKRLLQASDSLGFPLVVVDAKDGAKEFYLQYGFQPFVSEENKLFITMADIRTSWNP